MAAKFDAFAGVAELVDALDLGSSDESCGGSSPSARTNTPDMLRSSSRKALAAVDLAPSLGYERQPIACEPPVAWEP
jgi:hypothetical protein